MKPVIAIGAALLSILALATAGPAAAQSREVVNLGKTEFEFHCTVCHGVSGKGDGEMAAVLATKPADLTRLAAQNNGRFPFWRVYAVIGGEASVKGHEPFEMPGFWRRFRHEEGTTSLMPAELRILVLTHYVESLQSQ